MTQEVTVGGLEVVQHPPLIGQFVKDGSVLAHVLSGKMLDVNNYACLLQGKFGYAVGTLQVSGLDDGDVVSLAKLEGDNQNPIATILKH